MNGSRQINVKGIDKEYLVKTGMTAEQIAEDISDYLEETVNTITILSAGWDAMFGYYAVVRAVRNRLWVVSDGSVMPYNDVARERCLR